MPVKIIHTASITVPIQTTPTAFINQRAMWLKSKDIGLYLGKVLTDVVE
jgi:hypothetical protein